LRIAQRVQNIKKALSCFDYWIFKEDLMDLMFKYSSKATQLTIKGLRLFIATTAAKLNSLMVQFCALLSAHKTLRRN